MRRTLLFFLVPIVLALASCQVTRDFGPPSPWLALEDARLTESSGVAPSHRKRGVYYTHNDSGDKARLFRFGERGVLDEIEVQGAKARDWEDMASAKIDGKPYLFVGDIGDNLARRKSVVVYRIPEPKGVSSAPDRTFELTYPDGPMNAEALLVHPKTGDITIVGKRSSGPAPIYRLKAPRRSGRYEMRKVGEIQVGGGLAQARLITGGAYSPDGKFVVLRTYLAAYEFPVDRKGDWWSREPLQVRLSLDGLGEAITYTSEGDALITTSEGSPCRVSRVAVAP